MRATKYLILTALAATPVVVVLAVGATPQQRSTDVRRSHWEYRIVHENDLANATSATPATLVKYTEDPLGSVKAKEGKLNELGTDGWELVASEDHCLIFRRTRM